MLKHKIVPKSELELTDRLITRANALARRHGLGHATEIVAGDHDAMIRWQSAGYRKNTTGEYVSARYRANFGWKNTYYQPLECIVMLNLEI